MNPLAAFVSSTIVAFSLLVTLSFAAAAFVLIVELIILGVWMFGAGVRASSPARVSGSLKALFPLATMALLSAVTTVLYGRQAGQVYFSWGLMVVSQGSISLALVIGLRILAIGIPAVLLARNVDPTNLADSLTQLWHAPRRFVLGSLAAFRMLSLMVDDWRTLEMARRARGLGSGRGPAAAVARWSGQIFALLVLSLRRASTLALAMEARGISRTTPPTFARTAEWKKRDWGLIVASTLVSIGALILAIAQQNFEWMT